jgi:hypothetical protein
MGDRSAVLRPVLVRMLEGRVGSTLVMQLLASAPEVACDRVYPYENSYLTYLVRVAGRLSAQPQSGGDMVDLLYGDGARIGPLPFAPLSLDQAALGRAALAALWGAFARTLDPAGGARVYAEKFWGDAGEVIAAGIEPMLVDVVRDPRDVVASIRAFNAKTGRQLFGRAAVVDDRQHLRRLVVGMSLRLEEFAAEPAAPRLLVRYEDLIDDLDGQAARLSELVGVALRPDAVREAHAAMERHTTARTPESSVARWRADLPPDEVALIERRLGRHIELLGYTLSAGRGAKPPMTE